MSDSFVWCFMRFIYSVYFVNGNSCVGEIFGNVEKVFIFLVVGKIRVV